MKRSIAMTAAACGLCAGLVVPGAATAAASSQVVFDQSVAFPGTHLPADHNQLGQWVANSDDALVVVVPGTDDERSPRINDIVGDRDSTIVKYPESFWPIISGKSGKLMPFFAPTYDQSRAIAEANSLTVMQALADADRVLVYTGYSQGSDALGNAAEKAAEQGILGPNSTVLLVSDPRGPWGIKSFGEKIPLSGAALGLLGITNDGARDPGKTGDVKVVHVIVQGDPVANPQWVWYRPASSLLVNAAGFITIHSGTGPYTYAHTENLDHVKTIKSDDGNSTYEIYDTYHPLALLNAMVFESLGIPVSQQQLENWDKAAEKFYPTQPITAANADPKVKVHEVPLSSGPQVLSPVQHVTSDVAPTQPAVAEVPFAPQHQLVDDSGAPAEGTYPSGFAPSHAAPEVSEPEASTESEPASEVTAPVENSTPDTTPADAAPVESSPSEPAEPAGGAELTPAA